MSTLYSNADVADKNLDAELDTHTFTRTNVTTITLTPDGIDGKSRVAVSDGTSVTIVTLSSALTCNLTVAGAGGLDTGSEATSTGYECRLITKAAGADPVLLFTAAGSGTTIATATLPATYTLQSKILMFVHNDSSGDILPFTHRGKQVSFAGGFGGGFNNTAYNERDFTQFCPVNAGAWRCSMTRAHSTGTLKFSADGTTELAGFLSGDGNNVYTSAVLPLASITSYAVGVWSLGTVSYYSSTHAFNLTGWYFK